MAIIPLGQGPGCLPICHPGSRPLVTHPPWLWQPTPALEELTSRVASSGHGDSMPTPPKRPEKPSAVPSLLPGTLTRLQMRSSHVDPRGGLQKASLPSRLKCKYSRHRQGDGELKRLHPSQSGQRLRGTLGSCLPVRAHFSLASLGRSLGE